MAKKNARARRASKPPTLGPAPTDVTSDPAKKAIALRHFDEDELDTIARESKKGGLSEEEKLAILDMRFLGLQTTYIATRIGRQPGTVRNFLRSIRSRVDLGRAVIVSQVDKLAQRVVNMATVEESLEVLDRLDVLPKKQKEAANTGTNFNLIIGMPGGTTIGSMEGPKVIPVPSQKVIEAAKG